eukprot:10266205-Ditylum_brightwellii.AAC.1
MSSKHDQVTLMTFVRSTQEQRGIVKIEPCTKKLGIRKSNFMKVTLVFFTASMPTTVTVETDGDGHDGDCDGHDGPQY